MSNRASYEDLENAVLNAVAAIHCLSVERNSLRLCSEAQEDKMAALRDANEHSRRQLILIGDSYADYAASCAANRSPALPERLHAERDPVAAQGAGFLVVIRSTPARAPC